MSLTCAVSRSAALMAEMDMGTSCDATSRLVPVMTISSSVVELAPGWTSSAAYAPKDIIKLRNVPPLSVRESYFRIAPPFGGVPPV